MAPTPRQFRFRCLARVQISAREHAENGTGMGIEGNGDEPVNRFIAVSFNAHARAVFSVLSRRDLNSRQASEAKLAGCRSHWYLVPTSRSSPSARSCLFSCRLT